jgi:hypothetical protein
MDSVVRRTSSCAYRWILAGVFLLVSTTAGSAQNPDLILSKAERDSILKTYDNVFPIWGRKAIERGFDLPYPVGISVTGVWISQDIEITDLALSTGDNPTVPVEFIKFGQVKTPVASANVRGDLWVLPFLNVYGFLGRAWVTTDVSVVEPVAFNTVVESEGTYGGLGMVATMGIKHNWLAFDVNWAWTQTEKLDHPVRARIFGIRYGRVQKLRGTQRLAMWLGTMNQKLVSATDGSIALSEVIEGGGGEGIEGGLPPDYQESDWYQQLTPPQQRVVDAIADGVLGGNLEDATINYRLEKAVAQPWNMIAGASWDLSKRWTWRLEAGFIGRTQILGQLNYHFNW